MENTIFIFILSLLIFLSFLAGYIGHAAGFRESQRRWLIKDDLSQGESQADTVYDILKDLANDSRLEGG